MALRQDGLFRTTVRTAGDAIRRFAGAEDGVTAIEFALVATPFFGLMFAILETAIIFFSQQTLDTAIANAAREIRTGIAQQQGFSASQFKQRICSQVVALMDCTGGLSIDVRTYQTFDSINLSDPLDAMGNLSTANFIYDPGHGTDIVTVRAFYQWPTFSHLLGLNLGTLGNGNHLLAAAAAFRNEPFPW